MFLKKIKLRYIVFPGSFCYMMIHFKPDASFLAHLP